MTTDPDAVGPPEGVGGWLLLLCILLSVWGPIQVALVAANALAALPVRGTALGLLILVRVFVAAFGLTAGLALWTRGGRAVLMARIALVLSAATDAFVYLTPYFPSNRMPGDTVFFVAATIGYSGIWLAYLSWSRRVRRTYR
jgi:hypothetical protein